MDSSSFEILKIKVGCSASTTLPVSFPILSQEPEFQTGQVRCPVPNATSESPQKKQRVSEKQWDHKPLCNFTFTPYRVVGKGNFGLIQHGLWNITFNNDSHRVILHEVAIKSVLKQTGMHTQLKKEIEVLTKLQQLPFFTRLYAIVQDTRQLHLVLNYCAKGDLFSHIQRQIMQKDGLSNSVFQQQMMHFACEIVAAIACLHDQHILHADIKCENILITEKGHIQLCDFGLSDVDITSNSVYGTKGSELYMSPEQMRSAMYGLSVDVWALGYVFLHMFSNVLPRPHVYGSSINVNIEALDNDLLTPPSMKALIKQLLTVDRRERPTMAQVKNHEVFQHVDWTTVDGREWPLAVSIISQTTTDTTILETTTDTVFNGYCDGIFEDVFTQLEVVPILYEKCTSLTIVLPVYQLK